jgi:hypothetical protein
MRRTQLFAIAVLLLLACLPAAAQFRDLKVNIPFVFQIGEAKFDAGAYTFKQETRNEKMLVEGGKARQLIPTSTLQPESPFDKAHTTLIFHKGGNKYFLYQLWTKHIGYQMPTSNAEKEMIASGEKPSELKMNVKME